MTGTSNGAVSPQGTGLLWLPGGVKLFAVFYTLGNIAALARYVQTRRRADAPLLGMLSLLSLPSFPPDEHGPSGAGFHGSDIL